MRKSIDKVNRFLDAPLDVAPRVLLVLAFLLLVPTYLTPLYNMTMFAPQYPEGLRRDIYSYKLVGGNDEARTSRRSTSSTTTSACATWPPRISTSSSGCP